MFNLIGIFNKIEQIQSLDPQGLYIYISVCVCIHIMYTYMCAWVCAYVCIYIYIYILHGPSWDINGMMMGNTLR